MKRIVAAAVLVSGCWAAEAAAQRPAVSRPSRESVSPAPRPRAEQGRPQLALPAPTEADGSGPLAGARPEAATVVTSLAMVLGAFFLVAWVSRRKGGEGQLPRGAVEVLGRLPLGTKQSAQLIRVGSRLLLVASSPQGLSTLAEVSDPQEVQQLTEICRSSSFSLMRGAHSSGETLA